MSLALKCVLAVAVVWCGDATAAAAVRGPRPAGASVSHATVRLAEWAEIRSVALRWLQHDETLQLSTDAARIQLTVNSREARVNGVDIWLSFPPALRGGQVWVSSIDLESTLKPLLIPPKSGYGARVRTICLDPGHGGKDPGNCVGANQEKVHTLMLAEELRQLLVRQGFKVVLTRTGDKFLDLETRPDLAHRRGADLFVSLHYNSADTGRDAVRGAQVFCLPPPGAASTNARGESGSTGWCPGNRNNDRSLYLAYEIQRALTGIPGAQDLGVRRARFAVLREALMPAVLVEAGFMSHPVEGRKIFTAAYRQQLAGAIAQGVQSYARALESPDARTR